MVSSSCNLVKVMLYICISLSYWVFFSDPVLGRLFFVGAVECLRQEIDVLMAGMGELLFSITFISICHTLPVIL